MDTINDQNEVPTVKIGFDNLKPFVSVSIFKSNDASLVVNSISENFEQLMKTLQNLPIKDELSGRIVNKIDPAFQSNGYYFEAAWFKIGKIPSWFGSEGLDPESLLAEGFGDIQNHLIVVGSNSKYVIVYCSHPSLKDKINELVETGSILIEEGARMNKKVEINISHTATSLSREEMEKAFVRGEAKNIWMEGLHSQIVLKADRKILSGLDLRYALDSIGDQTFTYSAAISEFEVNEKYRIGVSYYKNTLWKSSTKKFKDFISEVGILLSLLDGKVPHSKASGFKVLAKPGNDSELKNLDEGFEMYFENSLRSEQELLTADEAQVDKGYEYWQSNFYFDVLHEELDSDASTIIAHLINKKPGLDEGDHTIAKVMVKPVSWGDSKIEIKARVLEYFISRDDERMVHFDKAMSFWLKRLVLRYGSGHIIQGKILYTLEFRNPTFANWNWIDFGGSYNLKKEKPTKPSKSPKKNGKVYHVYDSTAIGKQDSLFCYTKNNVQQVIGEKVVGDLSDEYLLLCDDGGEEIADFIVVDPSITNRVIIFIHIKGAKKVTNEIAIDRLSELTGMAQKNLSMFDQNQLLDKLVSRSSATKEKLAWNAKGEEIERSAVIEKIREIRIGASKHVVLFLPRIKQSVWDETLIASRNGSEGRNIGIMKQLNEMLASSEEILKRMGATMSAIGIEDDESA